MNYIWSYFTELTQRYGMPGGQNHHDAGQADPNAQQLNQNDMSLYSTLSSWSNYYH